MRWQTPVGHSSPALQDCHDRKDKLSIARNENSVGGTYGVDSGHAGFSKGSGGGALQGSSRRDVAVAVDRAELGAADRRRGVNFWMSAEDRAIAH